MPLSLVELDGLRGTHPAAYLRLAAGLDGGEAKARLEAYLADYPWASGDERWKTGATWWAAAGSLAWVNPPKWSQSAMNAALVAALVRGPVSDNEFAHFAVRQLAAGADNPEGVEHLKRLVGWLQGSATPGDARLVCDVVERHAYSLRGDGLELMAPLVAWLAEHGIAELRSEARAQCRRALVDVARTSAPELLPFALRMLVHHDPSTTRRLTFTAPWQDDRHHEEIWPLIEAAAERKTPESLLGQVVARTAPWVSARHGTLLAPWTGDRFPASRRILIGLMLANRIPAASLQLLWPAALRLIDPPGVAPGDLTLDAIRGGWSALLSGYARGMQPFPDPIAPGPRADAWSRFIVSEYLRRVEVDVPDIEVGHRPANPRDVTPRNRLLTFANADFRFRGTAQALDTLIASGELGEGAELAHRLVGSPSASRADVLAAIELLPAGPRPKAAVSAAAMGAIQQTFLRFIRHGWVEPVGGVDFGLLLSGIDQVSIEPLGAGDKVRLDRPTLRVDRNAAEGLARIPEPRRQQLSAIYLAHELAHVAQGLGSTTTVTRLRTAGGETTLMHVDLAADFVAAVAVAAAFPKWSLPTLRDIQGSSLGAYPVGWMHPDAARARKAVRLVSLRTETALRRRSLGPPAPPINGYVFVDFGPGGGEFCVFESGPVLKLLCVSPLDRAKAELLHAAADLAPNGTSVAEVDRIVGTLLDAARSE